MPFVIRWEPAGTPPPLRVFDSPSRGVHELFLGDALDVGRFLVQRGDTFDLLYMDPPFGTARTQQTTQEGGSYRDPPVEALLEMLYPVLELAPKLLTDRGGLLVHLDHRAVWAVKLMLDQILGPDRFQNQIIWHYRSGGRATRRYSRKHDVILWYGKGTAPWFDARAASSPRDRCALCGQAKRSSHLRTVQGDDGRLFKAIKSNGKTYLYDPEAGVPLSDVWVDIGHLHQLHPERRAYPSQKPLALLERLVGIHCPPAGRVLDLFAGSGTTLVAGVRLGREVTGGDANPEAIPVVLERLAAEGVTPACYTEVGHAE